MFLIHSDTLVAVEDNYKCNAMFSRDRDTERNLRFTIEVDCNTVLGRVAWNRNDGYDRAYLSTIITIDR